MANKKGFFVKKKRRKALSKMYFNHDQFEKKSGFPQDIAIFTKQQGDLLFSKEKRTERSLAFTKKKNCQNRRCGHFKYQKQTG